MNPLLMSLIRNDLKRNKVINATLFLFLLIAALLLSTGVLVIERLSGALDNVMEIAKPPHFMQMHIGEFDQMAIESLARKSTLVKQTQITAMVNIEGANMTFRRANGTEVRLSDSLLDNYFIAQNKHFDFLLDQENHIVEVRPGEVGIPVMYAKEKQVKVGDTLRLNTPAGTVSYKVSHLMRDAQMGSSLASSIRFVVHPTDFDNLNASAFRREVIIAFRLHDQGRISDFESLYLSEDAHMPKNGVSITLPLIKLMNGIGDGLMSGMIIVVSVVLVGISLMNMRFALLAAIEDEVREIGTLKAIGMTHGDIRQLYLYKYTWLSGIACILAAIASFGLSNLFTANIALSFGTSPLSVFTILLPLIAAFIMFILVNLSLRRILKSVAKLTILQALLFGHLPSKSKKSQSIKAPKRLVFFKSAEITLSLHLLIGHLRAWLLIMSVFFLATLILLMPLNLYSTLSSPDFIKYMGAAKSDVRMALAAYPQIERDTAQIEAALSAEKHVTQWHRFATLKSYIMGQNGLMRFPVETGDFNKFPIDVELGKLPEKSDEIALSAMNAKRLELEIGQSITLYFDLGVTSEERVSKTFTVVGVYQDVTNGGITAKVAAQSDASLAHVEVEQYAYFIDIDSVTRIDTLVDAWSAAFPHAKTIALETLMDQTLGTITRALRVAVIAIFIVVMALVSLVTVLFITLRMQKQKTEDAILMATGFTQQAVRSLYFYQGLIAMGISIGLGAVASLYLGEGFIALLLTMMSFGLTHMTFLIQPLYFVLFGLLMPLLLGLTLIILVTNKLKGAQLCNY